LYPLGYHVTEEQLQDVAEQSRVLEGDKDFLTEEFRAACLEIIPFPELVEPNECSHAFVYLKANIKIPDSVSVNV
jgi:hypothetical protein